MGENETRAEEGVMVSTKVGMERMYDFSEDKFQRAFAFLGRKRSALHDRTRGEVEV